MTSSCYFCFLLLMTSLFHFCLSTQNLNHVLCKDVERHALLQFKHALIDPADRLASWVGEEKDCCSWAGIVCDNFTGHVHRIHLRGVDGHCRVQDYTTPKEYNVVSKLMLSGDLSPSLLHLQQLRHLDLSCNDFGGIQVPRFIGSLRNLRYLNLSGSGFGGIIPPQLGNLSELQVLCLDNLGSTIPMRNMHWLSSLHLLHHLDMSGMDLSKVINPFQVINTLSSLVELHLSDCQLSHMHPHVSRLINISSLSVLDLSFNNFNSSIPCWIFSITSLVSLDLSECGFHGPIRGSFGFQNFTALKLLHVSGNDFMNSSLVFKGLSSIGSNLISLDISSCGVSSPVLDGLHNLTSLLSLKVSQNQLTKRIPKSLGNLCDLRVIDLSVNDFRYISLTNLLESLFECKSPSLESLSLRSSGLSGQLPDQLGELIHLVHLDIQENRITGMVPDSIGQLSFLRSLRLGSNLVSGPIPNSIGGLASLEVLELWENGLNGSLPDSLVQLLNLKRLYLSYNLLSGVLPDSLGQLSNLERLDLSFNELCGNLPDSVGQLSNLTLLYLSYNRLSGNLPDSLGQLSNLVELDLSENLLSGSLPDSLDQLSNLVELDLSENLLSGSLPDSLGQLSNLSGLYLAYNELSGSLPDWLGQLSNLVELDFSHNLLTGFVTKYHLAKLASLKYLNGRRNNLTFKTQLANWVPPFQLKYLYLDSWDLGPQFPLWLQLQRDLEELQISNTNISVPIPQSFWRSFPNLSYLDMSQNHIQGTLLFSVPETLSILDLSSNEFTGQLHHFMCPHDEKGIADLNLGNNQLSGVIPECWMKWPSLISLNLENNNLSGEIPRTLGFSSNLQSLNMQGNKLSGRILPVSLMNLTKLTILQLGRNELVGCIPTWFGSSLRILNLRLNNFDGNIPHELCYLTTIHILDLAYNNLSGNIPRCFHNFTVLSGNKTELNYIGGPGSSDSESLMMKGREYIYSITTLRLVLLVDLSSNNFSGYIPSELTALCKLMSLNLSRNQLTGRIPEKIGDMKSLESFDLSSNKLSGELPTSLSSLSFLSYFNVSYNGFTGRIPSSTQLQGFNESSFFGNNLCGDPLTKRCVVEVPDGDQEGDDWSHEADWGLIISMVCGFIAGFWIIVAPLMVSRSWRIAYFRFLNGLRYMGYDVIHKICV